MHNNWMKTFKEEKVHAWNTRYIDAQCSCVVCACVCARVTVHVSKCVCVSSFWGPALCKSSLCGCLPPRSTLQRCHRCALRSLQHQAQSSTKLQSQSGRGSCYVLNEFTKKLFQSNTRSNNSLYHIWIIATCVALEQYCYLELQSFQVSM